MPRFRDIGLILTCIAAFSSTLACTGRGLKTEPTSTWEDPIAQVNRFENDLTTARKNQVHLLAPAGFAKAEASLKQVRRALDEGRGLAEILETVARGRASLRSAQEMAQLARTMLADTLQARALAREAGAIDLGDDYTDAEQAFLKLARAIEDGNLQWAQGRKEEVTEAFRQLELRVIKGETLGEVRRLIERAEDEGARKLAPRTLKMTREKLGEVDEFISQHPHQKEEVHRKADEALFHARRLLQVTRLSAKLRTMQPEEVTLWVEEIVHRATLGVGAPDMRDDDFETQIQNVIASVKALREDHQFLQEKAKSQEAEIAALKRQQQIETEAMRKRIASLEGLAQEQHAAKERLAAEKRFEQLYTRVQEYFEPDEAAVYRQGNQLIIRLKAMQFPVGKHTIAPSHYSLLGKVQRAILTFGEPHVVIEGHTDSTGAAAVNEHLSQQRADAVRKYFLSHDILTEEKIVAVGYGSSRPLASNDTEEGRAVNRRIDVIITPQRQAVE